MSEDGMTFSEQVEENMKEYLPYLNALEGSDRLLAESLVRDLCEIEVEIAEVSAQIRGVGYNIVNKQGNLVRNPDVMTKHQLINEKSALIPKIKKLLNSDAIDKADELTEFLRG